MTLRCPPGCGACCRFGQVVRLILGDDWPLRDDGACGHLTADARCDIYETRPDQCRIVPPDGADPRAYYEEQAKACGVLQGILGLPINPPEIA